MCVGESMKGYKQIYDTWFAESVPPIEIEMKAIQSGGFWNNPDGKRVGRGLFHHYRSLQSILWPEDDHHRWSDLILSTVLDNRLTVIMGAKDSGKTYTISKLALTDYWCFPNNTLTLMSSTDIRGLELRVWGTIKDLFQRALERFPDLPGNVVDAKHGVFTDSLGEEAEVRDMRKGILCIPCIGSNGEWTGIDKFLGIKQFRRWLLGDELQFLKENYLKALANLDKGSFKCALMGNPIGQGDPLDKAAEPVAGWDSLGDVKKTTTWKNRFDGVTINLVGTDSPNFDVPKTKSYPYLIDQSDVDRVTRRFGADSALFWSQIMGVRKAGLNAHRVLTREMCIAGKAFDDAIWGSDAPVKLFGLDAGYGGDLCVGMCAEFGADVHGVQILRFHKPVVVPVAISSKESPEDQIALFVRNECQRLGVIDENVFFEAGMRATLAISLSRTMSASVNAVNFGGQATDRPVSNDFFIYDEKDKMRRLKKCSEHYSKYVSQLWFSVRAAVECAQIRELPEEAANEFYAREWAFVHGDRYELETKAEMKERLGYSPNYADAASICLEGAQRLGFVIEKLKPASEASAEQDYWLEKEMSKHQDFRKRHELKYV